MGVAQLIVKVLFLTLLMTGLTHGQVSITTGDDMNFGPGESVDNFLDPEEFEETVEPPGYEYWDGLEPSGDWWDGPQLNQRPEGTLPKKSLGLDVSTCDSATHDYSKTFVESFPSLPSLLSECGLGPLIDFRMLDLLGLVFDITGLVDGMCGVVTEVTDPFIEYANDRIEKHNTFVGDLEDGWNGYMEDMAEKGDRKIYWNPDKFGERYSSKGQGQVDWDGRHPPMQTDNCVSAVPPTEVTEGMWVDPCGNFVDDNGALYFEDERVTGNTDHFVSATNPQDTTTPSFEAPTGEPDNSVEPPSQDSNGSAPPESGIEEADSFDPVEGGVTGDGGTREGGRGAGSTWDDLRGILF